MLALAALLASACGEAATRADGDPTNGGSAPPGGDGKPALVISAADRQSAQQKFESLCATCHGKTGLGDGPGSAALTPKPRNFQDPAWQTSVTDEHIEKIIVFGGAAVGKALTMPGNPDLRDKPAVVAALREHIRGLVKN